MDPNTFPTKGNLILAKNTLKLSKQGYDLLDKKRNVLIREMMDLNERAQTAQAALKDVFHQAYQALQRANIHLGIVNVERLSFGVPIENSLKIKIRSIMGVEIPLLDYQNQTANTALFGMSNTSSALDEALQKFNKAKDLAVSLAVIENTAFRLATAIKKTQKRANALKNVTIPKFEELSKTIQASLEERERDEFTRLKVMKKNRENNMSSYNTV